MKKLSLNVEELSIQSFETQETPTPRGTVRGKISEIWATCEDGDLSYPGSCEPDTCYEGCTNGCTTTSPQPTRALTCEVTAPDPVGTCCHVTC